MGLKYPQQVSNYPSATTNNEKIPILAEPYIVEEYSENVVDTLHKKNLLSLGEDRFLTTLMLRNFPKRKMVFIPQAVCHTTVPEDFKTLLSQRRRWINSTIHNLLELVFLKDLCGIFCCSMQFVVGVSFYIYEPFQGLIHIYYSWNYLELLCSQHHSQ
jgi:chitin synthase